MSSNDPLRLLALWTDVLKAYHAMWGSPMEIDGCVAYNASESELQDWADDEEARLGRDVTGFRAALLAFQSSRACVWSGGETPDTEASLERELTDFCIANGYPLTSADDLIHEPLCDGHRVWLTQFIGRCEHATEVGHV